MDNFEEVIGRLLLVHAEVKAIDRSALSEKRRKERAEQMAALRRNINQLVVVKFEQLAAGARDSSLQLDEATQSLSRSLHGIKTAIGVLDAVGAALGTITRLVRLVRGA